MGNNSIMQALIKEAHFTCEILCAGVIQIRKTNYAKKGIYFQSFASLSTGLERIGKLCLILDYYIRNNGKYPDNSYLKHDMGHDIEVMYQELLKIKQEYNLTFDFLKDLESDIHKEILCILSQFAKGDRCSELNLIANRSSHEDPIKVWYENVDLYCYNKFVTKNKKATIQQNAKIIGQLIGASAMIGCTKEDENDADKVENASFRTCVFEAVAPMRQLYVFQIIRFFVEMLICLQYKIMQETILEVPYFSEIFGIFYNNDQYIETRKAWEMI